MAAPADASKDAKKDAAAATDATKSKAHDRRQSEEAKKLDWKFAQRSDVSDLVARGIVSEEYEDVLKGDKDIDDAEKEHKKHQTDATSKIDKVFKNDLRPSPDDVEEHGLAPKGSLALEKGHEYDDAVKKAENEKEAAKKKLAAKFGQRMKPDEAVARNIIDQDALNKDYDTIEKDHQKDKAKIAEKLQRNMGQRPDASEMVARGIAEDEKEVGPNAEDYDKIEAAKKQEKKDTKKALDDWKRPSPQDVAKKGVISNDELPAQK